MAKVSLNQAAKDTGVSLPTLSRWRSKGKITADKTGNGGYLIDTSEYDRINALKKRPSNVKHNNETLVKYIETPNESSVLELKIKMLEERLHEKNELLEELRTEKNDWKNQAQTLLLNPPQKPVEPRKKFLGII